MKLWQKETTIDQKIETFTIGKDQELDLQLAEVDIIGSIAHVKMLLKIGLLKTEEANQLHWALIDIYNDIQAGQFKIEKGIEDVHSQVEYLLTKELGAIGKKIHSGRSRNDQVLVDLKLFFRSEIILLFDELDKIICLLLDLSDQYKEVLMPGYTHTQMAMISSFGLWFASFAETLVDDAQLLKAAYHIINQNPLGSAAGFGSSFPLDRTYTTELLGFENLSYNVMHAQQGRGKSELALSYALSAIAMTIGKLATDVIQYSNQNYNFLQLPEKMTTGSSIMPHKKNPDVFELIRAKCNRMMALPNEISMIINNLQSGYHRDFQLLKESVFPALAEIKNICKMNCYALENIKINHRILEDDNYKYLFTVETVNQKVLEGIPFRTAYQEVGEMIENGSYTFDKTINHQHEGSIGNLCNPKIKKKWKKLKKELKYRKTRKKINKLLTKKQDEKTKSIFDV